MEAKTKNWKTIPIPERMKGLPVDPRGYPVPYIIFRDGKGKYYFQINEEERVTKAINEDLCAICGQKMNGDTWLVGGPQSAFHPYGCYIDSCTHKECLTYALQVCPYLAAPNYKKRIDLKNVNPEDYPDQMFFQDPTQDDIRVPFFVAVHIKSFTVSRPEPGKRYLHPDKNYLAIEFWNDGVEITREDAVKLMHEHVKNPQSGIK